MSQVQPKEIAPLLERIRSTAIANALVTIATTFARFDLQFVRTPSRKIPSIDPPVTETIWKANQRIFCTG
jgi:hypothetical protein